MERNDDADRARLLKELQAVPKAERLDYLAGLPPERRAEFKRILPREDIRKLTSHMDRLVRQRSAPSYETWIADARAGRASSADAMVEVLREALDRLRPQDATWIRRITDTSPGGSYSKRQEEVIRAIYARYFGRERS
ncbi:MAG: hypothetical protein ACYTJ0_10085 [Planctomycetota bacterium]|jgi:hypothetical protein